ncbi:dnaJ homolog subfamily C member 9 isoform X1 [Lepisosteus oculatus]|uniref:dnaJ homolog subfamily C member 9 isoform X1 n=1 Tax=Lepisosteus oculatus TaxID=7918 RepID=UPI003717222C
MGLIDLCQELFGSPDLYQVLRVSRGASGPAVRRGYYKVSMEVHPDRAPSDPRATEKFQTLGKVYAVLSDAEQRAVYDEQGIVDEEADSLQRDRCWEEYWRLLFPKLTVEDIVKFENKYKGSQEEKNDVHQLYLKFKGNMDKIMMSILCGTYEDEPRIRDLIQEGIDAEDLPAYETFTHEPEKKKVARKRKAEREKKEAEKLIKERKQNEEAEQLMKEQKQNEEKDQDLVAALQTRQKSREQEFNSLLSDLENKYCKKGAKGGKGKRPKK